MSSFDHVAGALLVLLFLLILLMSSFGQFV